MLPALLCGIGVGIGLWVCVRAAYPATRPLSEDLAALSRPQSTLDARPDAGRWDRLARVAVALSLFDNDTSLQRDLACLDRSADRYALERLAAAAAGSCLPALVAVLCAAGGVNVPTAPIMISALALAIAGYFVPRLVVRTDAARRHDDFRHGLSAYLDLVAILLAGGRGIESALWDAAGTGSGWTFRLLRSGLEQAAREGRSPWAVLTELADRLGLDELAQLTSSITLAGDSGAKVKASLVAKAASLRDHELASVEAAAERATEQMAGPVVLLLVAFLLFIGWPALANVLAL